MTEPDNRTDSRKGEKGDAAARRRIAVLTGKRGGFGAMLGIMERIQMDPGMELRVIATDMHLSATFGSTLAELRERITVDRCIDLGDYGDRNLDRARALGRCVERLAPVLDELDPDLLLILGDRGESLAAAMCAVEMGVTVAHIQAGDISGGVDEIHRHAIAKLAHLHFSQNESQRQRVIRLGEAEERVWNTGSPYVDNIFRADLPTPEQALDCLGLAGVGPFYLVLQHSDTYRPEASYQQMHDTLSALASRPEHSIVVYPCSDPGYAGIIRAINEFESCPNFHVFRNIEAMTFLGLMKGARALIGNSSAGIIEAPYFHLPYLLVGHRQDGRDIASNMIRVDPTPGGVLAAIAKSQTPEFRDAMKAHDKPFGDGNACERIFTVLRDTDLSPELFRKRITY